MSAGQPWDEATAAAIGVPWIETQIAAFGMLGRRARAREQLFGPGDEARAQEAIAAVAEAAARLSRAQIEGLRAIVGACPDPSDVLAHLAAGGAADDVDFFTLLRFCDALEAVAAQQGDAFAPPQQVLSLLAQGRVAGGGFYLHDRFDPALASARARLAGARTAYDAARERAAEAAVAALGLSEVPAGEFIVMRDRLSGALPAGIRVVREAPTYLLCEVALDETARAALALRDAVAAEVAQCERHARQALSRAVASVAPALEAAAEAVGRLEGRLARVDFAQRYPGCVPHVVERPVLAFEDARFEPLAERTSGYVALSLRLDGVAVLSGPNMGGKTAALATCGFVAACIAFGLPVPAVRVESTLFETIVLAGIGAQEPPGATLSSFGREIVATRAVLERASHRALVLVDEFARTTSYRAGRALAAALIEALRAAGATALVTTHDDGLGELARCEHLRVVGFTAPAQNATQRTISARDALRELQSGMDYRIVGAATPVAHALDGIDVAAYLGLPYDLVRSAREIFERAGGTFGSESG